MTAVTGGYGTFDKLFEALTSRQLGIDRKPIGLLDAGGFWAPMLTVLDSAVAAGFLRPVNRELLHADASLDLLLQAFSSAWGSECTHSRIEVTDTKRIPRGTIRP